MLHDATLLELLRAFPIEEFKGDTFRATRKGLDPLAFSTRGGRWVPAGDIAVLYTSLTKDGALAEISFHWGQLTPLPSKPAVLHTISVTTSKTLRLLRDNLNTLGVNDDAYTSVNYDKTRRIGAAVAFLGYDGLIAPSARWTCDNLIVFGDHHDIENELRVKDSAEIEWLAWAKANHFIDT